MKKASSVYLLDFFFFQAMTVDGWVLQEDFTGPHHSGAEVVYDRAAGRMAPQLGDLESRMI